MKHLPRWIVNTEVVIALTGLVTVLLVAFILPYARATTYERNDPNATSTSLSFKLVPEAPKVLDTKKYDLLLEKNANYASTTATTTERLWPAEAPYPNYGALLPEHRIIAFYGNFYSTKMGVLGEYPRAEMIAKLKGEMQKWEAADPTTKTVPAINYIAVTAQGTPGKFGEYNLRMPDSQIDYALELAHEVNGIVILDIQVGTSNLHKELPLLEKYFAMPEVHLGLDPEFSMKGGDVPGTVIGTFDATDINYAANYLADLVKEHNLPPKVLIVHRFTQRMVTNSSLITPLPEVQVVMDMDGWGDPARKLGTYKHFIASSPVQFTGFKLFYKNDLKPPSTRMLTYPELLKLTPQPVFIQYQ